MKSFGGDYINEILLTVILTLLIHSLIGTVIYIATDENDTFIAYYGLGVIGLLLSGFFYIVRLIKRWWHNHDKRSIFENENGNRFYCEVKYAEDFSWHYDKMVKRYATKDEWKDLTPFTKEQIEDAMQTLDEESQFAGACAIAEKYMRSKEPTRENFAKAFRYLMSKGFDYEVSRKALDRLGRSEDEDE